MSWPSNLRRRTSGNALRSAAVALAALVSGCASTGAPAPDGLGGILGAAAGPEARGVIVGDDVGAGVGHVIGDAADRAKAARLDVTEHYEVGRVGATRWRVVDVQPPGRVPSFENRIVYFRPDGRVETTTMFADGRTEKTEESYRVVGDTIILSRRGYLVNATYRIAGQQMTIDGEGFRVTLVRLPS